MFSLNLLKQYVNLICAVIGHINFEQLSKVVSARFLHGKVNFLSLGLNILGEGTLKLCECLLAL